MIMPHLNVSVHPGVFVALVYGGFTNLMSSFFPKSADDLEQPQVLNLVLDKELPCLK